MKQEKYKYSAEAPGQLELHLRAQVRWLQEEQGYRKKLRAMRREENVGNSGKASGWMAENDKGIKDLPRRID